MTPTETASHLIHLLTTQGTADYIGEPISQLQHSLQAAHLASTSSSDPDLIIAALLHDIGQFLPTAEVLSLSHSVKSLQGNVGRAGHERIGELYLLRLGFSEKVAGLVGSHVVAKRYLCAVEPGYWGTLSEASKKSLELQGGVMGGEELEGWGRAEICEDMCALRKWDDMAKVVGLEVESAEAYRGLIVGHLEERLL